MLQSAPSGDGDFEVPYLNASSVQWEGVVADETEQRTMWASASDVRTYSVRPGDLLVCEGGDVGRAAVYDGPPGFLFQNSLHRVRARGANDVRFLRYVFMALAGTDFLDVLCNKATIRHLTREKLGELLLPMPEPSEQRRISDFLDVEIARLDRVIAVNERNLALLQERWDARVANLVTGAESAGSGRPTTNAFVPVVGSGWRLGRLKDLASRIDVGIAEAATHAFADAGVPMFRSTNIRPNVLEVDDLLFIDPAFDQRNHRKRVRANDILTVRTGNAGVSAVVPVEWAGSQTFTQLITSLHPYNDSYFVCFYLNSLPARNYFAATSWGTAQRNISVPLLANMPVPFPSERAQAELGRLLLAERENFVLSVAAIQRRTDLLRERRVGLVSAAIAGDLDARVAA